MREGRPSLRKTLVRRVETLIGMTIVIVSIFGAYVTWRAAVAAGTASDFDQQGRQSAVLGDQIRAGYEAAVSYEERLFDTFRARVELADALDRDASSGRTAGPEAARQRTEAQASRAVARSLELPFASDPVSAGFPGDPRSGPSYDAGAERSARLAEDSQLQELRPERLRAASDEARDRRLGLVAVDTAVVGSIFFFTLALLAARMRRQLATVGLSLAAVGVAGFVVVEIVLTVPSL